jgi:hypothetical protein
VGGFNANELAPPIPEPQTWALLMAGLAVVGSVVRRNPRR